MGAIEPLTGGTGFYSNVFVLKCTGGLQIMHKLKHFNCHIHIPTFKIPSVRQV